MLFYIPVFSLPPMNDLLQYSIEFRERYERRDDKDFTAANSDNGAKLLTRGRIALQYELTGSSFAKVVYQYDNVQSMPAVGSVTQATRQDLVEAYVKKSQGGSTLTIGRQKVNKGGQRLIGALEWANSSRSWTGVRVQSDKWDFFWGRLASNPAPNGQAQMALASFDSPLGQSMLVYKHDKMPALPTSVYMLDHRYDNDFGAVRIVAEGAYQWGRKAGRDQDAWAASLKATLPVSDRLSVFVEANIATGGSSAGKTRTFDNMYPTNHLFYGAMDYQGWSNMKGVSVGATWKAGRNASVTVSYHSFSLYDDTDGWYGASGKINVGLGGAYIDPTGLSGGDIGSEFDVVLKWKLDKNKSLQAGVGVFQPGSFVKSFIAGSATESFWGYLQFATRF